MVFDDVFAALDNNTADRISDNLFGPAGLLRRMNITTVRVTRALHAVSPTDDILVLNHGGTITYHGAVSAFTGKISCTHNTDTATPKVAWSSKEVSLPLATEQVVEDAHTTNEQSLLEGSNQREASEAAVYTLYVGAIGKLSAVLFLTLLAMSSSCVNFSSKSVLLDLELHVLMEIASLALWLSWWASARDLTHNFETAVYPSMYATLGVVALVTFAAACWYPITQTRKAHVRQR